MSEKGQQSLIGAQKRKEKFSEEELKVLTAEVTQHEIELFGKASANISYATKEAICSSIVEKVNAVTRRTVNQVMKRWQDLRRQKKAKLAIGMQQEQDSSCSCCIPIASFAFFTSQLTPLERQAERTIHPKQSDPGFEYAESSLSCPSSLKVLPVLNKSPASPHQEVSHSSHPVANDRSLQVCGFIQILITRFYNGLHLTEESKSFWRVRNCPSAKQNPYITSHYNVCALLVFQIPLKVTFYAS
ncbi:UNVERIFIED_CONTAM: hypothetical protein FKN15_049685 [Acipenser sinensis]